MAVSSSAAGHSLMPGFSADSAHMAFISAAKNLVTNDDLAEFYDVFVADLVSSNIALVSVNTSGIGGGNDHSTAPSLSSNAQFVAFASLASNLVTNDTNSASDIFVRDLSQATTRLVSVKSLGSSSGNGSSTKPFISGDGRYIVFESLASDLVANDTNNASDVFIRDLELGATSVVSVNCGGNSSASAGSRLLHVTPDCRFVVFLSSATDIDATATNGSPQIYRRDLDAGITSRLHLTLADGRSIASVWFQSSFSVDGRYIALVPDASPGDTAKIYRYDFVDDSVAIIQNARADLSAPALSSDGETIAFSMGSQIGVWTSSNGTVRSIEIGSSDIADISMSDNGRLVFVQGGQVFSWDGVTNTLLSASTSGVPALANMEFVIPALSPNGRFAAFESAADNLVESDLNKSSDIFVSDLDGGSLSLISRRDPTTTPPATGTALTTLSDRSLNANGTKVIFTSGDSVLVPNDTNVWRDLMMRDVTAGQNRRVTQVPFVDSSPFSPTNRITSSAIDAEGRHVLYNLAYGPPIQGVTNGYRLDVSSNLLSPAGGGDGITVGAVALSMSSDGRFALCRADNGSISDIVLRDFRQPPEFREPPLTPANVLVSGDVSNRYSGDAPSVSGIVSGDGRFVIFTSFARNLTTNSFPSDTSTQHIFAYDVIAGSKVLLDTDTDGRPLPGGAEKPLISGNTRFVFFTGTGDGKIYRADLWQHFQPTINNVPGPSKSEPRAPVVVCTDCASPSCTADGDIVAYEMIGTVRVIVLKDLRTGLSELITAGLNGAMPNGPSMRPSLSYDARFVTFESKASNLVTNDFNTCSDIFVRDRWKQFTSLLSATPGGRASGNGPSTHPVLSPNGRVVAFQSFASDLAEGDYNNTRDVFLARLEIDDQDGDHPRIIGLKRTHPWDSVFELWWTAIPGKAYQVQGATSASFLNSTNFPQRIVAGSATAWNRFALFSLFENNRAVLPQFFRIVTVP